MAQEWEMFRVPEEDDEATSQGSPSESPAFGLNGSRAASLHRAQFFTVQPKELKVLGRLGCGAQAEVFKAEWTRTFVAGTSSIIVAVKQMHSDVSHVYRDREALTLLTDHPNLVKCFDSTVDPPYLVITEYCSGGSLFDAIYNSRYALTANQNVKVLLDIACGMAYLHAQAPCILHRDLKSSNVLLTKMIRSAEQTPFAKVADFGLARTSPAGATSSLLTLSVGTWRWMAPEVFELDEDDPDIQSYDKSADVFSFAMVMYEVLARKLPYLDQFPHDTADPRIGLYVSSGLRPLLSDVVLDAPGVPQLMERSWNSVPQERPTFEDLEIALSDLIA